MPMRTVRSGNFPSAAAKPDVQAEPKSGLIARARGAILRRVHTVAERALLRGTPIKGTSGRHELSELTIASANRAVGVHFVSAPWAVLSWVHGAVLPAAHKQRWTFIDYGAGKGRAVLSAANRPYRRVIGVEFAAELAEIACANLNAAGCDPARVFIVEGDAMDYEMPDGRIVAFLFNPFGPSVLRPVVERLIEHRARTRMAVRIAYLNPVHEHVLASHPGLKRLPLSRSRAALFGIASPYRLVIYDAV